MHRFGVYADNRRYRYPLMMMPYNQHNSLQYSLSKFYTNIQINIKYLYTPGNKPIKLIDYEIMTQFDKLIRTLLVCTHFSASDLYFYYVHAFQSAVLYSIGINLGGGENGKIKFQIDVRLLNGCIAICNLSHVKLF